jgi:ribosome-binding protein aMBF1 (putative translation factor)
MKKMRSLKWLIAAGALAMAVGLGAVACDSSDADQGAAQRTGTNESAQSASANMGNGTMMAQRQAVRSQQAMKDRREARAERQKALAENTREEMSAEDQALYDQLTATIEQQRTAAQEARQELADTLKELRALVAKYLELNGPGTN